MEKAQISSIVRALDILECFMDSSVEWTLKNLVDRLDLPTTTVFRQVSTLVERGYLKQDPVRKSYQAGPRLLLLCSTVLSRNDLRSIARPELEQLSATVKETVNLSLPLGREIFYLDKVETFRSVVCNTKVGTRAPAHATSGGKILLAAQSEKFVDDYCRDLPEMKPLTDKTIVLADRLRAELAQARINGYAIDDGEIEPGLICVGAPIISMNQKITAAVSIAGPAFRMQEDLDFMIREVKKTAAAISRLLGGQP
ncbi:putative IclR family transcriptional regulator [Oscillibacter valericigenes Sjm18-20]|nr:putative IclR family transcriptional regulator [Oscillibacter valericigenes Sjm18-20]